MGTLVSPKMDEFPEKLQKRQGVISNLKKIADLLYSKWTFWPKIVVIKNTIKILKQGRGLKAIKIFSEIHPFLRDQGFSKGRGGST